MEPIVRFSRPDPRRLSAETRSVRTLDRATRVAMWALYRGTYDRADEARFLADLDQKDDVIIVRDALGALQGFTTLCCYRHGGVRVVFSGDTVIAAPFQGQTALQRAFVGYVMRVVVRAREPVYWFLISKGYKTYLLLSRNFLEYWPRHDRPTPAAAQALLASLARERFGAAYRPEQGIVRFEPPGPRLEPGVAPLDPREADRPDIRFFEVHNPGWVNGDELCCIGRVDLAMGLNYVRRLVLRRVRRR